MAHTAATTGSAVLRSVSVVANMHRPAAAAASSSAAAGPNVSQTVSVPVAGPS